MCQSSHIKDSEGISHSDTASADDQETEETVIDNEEGEARRTPEVLLETNPAAPRSTSGASSENSEGNFYKFPFKRPLPEANMEPSKMKKCNLTPTQQKEKRKAKPKGSRQCCYCVKTLGKKQSWDGHFDRFHSNQHHKEFNDLAPVIITKGHGVTDRGQNVGEESPQGSPIEVLPLDGSAVGGSSAIQPTSSKTIATFTGSSFSINHCNEDGHGQEMMVNVVDVSHWTPAELNLHLPNVGVQPQEQQLTKDEIESTFVVISDVSTSSSTSTSSVSAIIPALANSSSTSTSASSTTALAGEIPTVLSDPCAGSHQEMTEELNFLANYLQIGTCSRIGMGSE